jgi:hypothetical protein
MATANASMIGRYKKSDTRASTDSKAQTISSSLKIEASTVKAVTDEIIWHWHPFFTCRSDRILVMHTQLFHIHFILLDGPT